MTTVVQALKAALDDAPVMSVAFWNGRKLYFASFMPEKAQGERAFVAEVASCAVLNDPAGAVADHVRAAFDFWSRTPDLDTGPCEVCGRQTPRHRAAPCNQCFEDGRI